MKHRKREQAQARLHTRILVAPKETRVPGSMNPHKGTGAHASRASFSEVQQRSRRAVSARALA